MGRHLLVLVLFGLAAAVHASSTLRVGNQVLTAGDSAMRVTELLGKPSFKSHRNGSRNSNRRSRRTRVVTDHTRGELWQYRRGGQVTTVTIVDGRVSDIEEGRL